MRPRARVRDRRRSVGKRVRAISAVRVRGRQALATIDRLTAEIAARAKQTVREVLDLAAEAQQQRGGALVDRLEQELEAAEQVLAQTDLRLAGQRTIPDRRISLVDPDARPIRMGRPHRPTEFGYKARMADTAEGRDRRCPRPRRSHRRQPARRRDRQGEVGRDAVRSIYADRGFGTSTADQALARHRIRDSVIPRQQRAAPIEHTRSWKRRYRFRNGSRAGSRS